MTDDTPAGLLDRTLANLVRAWSDLSGSTRYHVSGRLRADLPDEDRARVRSEMEACVAAVGDAATNRARAAELGRRYLELDRTGRIRFLHELATGFDRDRDAVDRALAQLGACGGDAFARREAEQSLHGALEPRWRVLLRQFTTLPEGMKFLVDLRAQMLEAQGEHPEIRFLADDLRTLLSHWFDLGLLDLRRIDWASPARLLEKLIAYEAVHEIRSWEDLKNRLDSDRRCFAFLHPNMPDEPLIFVEVALVNGMAASVDELLDETAPAVDPRTADTAVFYSISNAQRGLDGISFGNFLIRHVVGVLEQELPNLRSFATLSPIPGLSRWVRRQVGEAGTDLLTASERRALPVGDVGLADLLARLEQGEGALEAALREPLTRLAARYLTSARRQGNRAHDPVAHFHLSNGARVERLNWMGDRSVRGHTQSWGLMVNYLYRTGDIAVNSARYATDGRIAASQAIRSLARD